MQFFATEDPGWDVFLWQSHASLTATCIQGGAKVSEASVIYQELGERHNWTAQLYNGAAACAMQLGNWEEAEQYLQVKRMPACICNSINIATGVYVGYQSLRTLGEGDGNLSMRRSRWYCCAVSACLSWPHVYACT